MTPTLRIVNKSTGEHRTTPDDVIATLSRAREAQSCWAGSSINERLRVIRQWRELIAEQGLEFAKAVQGVRASSSIAEIVASELIPLCDALRFLERSAKSALKPRRFGAAGRPIWLRGVDLEVHREPFGTILVIAPSNYPLFLAGVHAAQALVAGNAAVVKPGRGASSVLRMLAEAAEAAGIPQGLLSVLDETVASSQEAIAAGIDKVVLTGSESTGRDVLDSLANNLTPSVMELSGCDAVVVLPSADIDRAVRAIRFGIQLNSSATCIRPSRVLVHAAISEHFAYSLATSLSNVSVRVDDSQGRLLRMLLDDALGQGAELLSGACNPDGSFQPFIVRRVRPSMRLWNADVFAPVIALAHFESDREATQLCNACKYGLGVSIFGSEEHAHALSHTLDAGVVTINDVIVPTADPRLPFSGRKSSGFGVTRGTEGLLEMTRVKAISTRRSKWLPHLEQPAVGDTALLLGMLQGVHGKSISRRFDGWKQMFKAAMSRRTIQE